MAGGRKGIALVVLLAAGLAVAPSASATIKHGGDFTYVLEQVNLPGNGSAHVQADCPSGDHVISGGYATPAGWNTARITEDEPLIGPGNQPNVWGVSAESLIALPQALTVKAVCAHVKPKYRAASEQIDPGDQEEVIASCHDDEKAIDGAYLPLADADIRLNSASPQGTTFPMYLDNHEGSIATVNTLVICIKHAKVKARSRANTVTHQQQKLDTSPCPKKGFKYAVGGGQTNGGIFGDINQPTSIVFQKDSYVNSVDNLDNMHDFGWTSIVLCMKGVG